MTSSSPTANKSIQSRPTKKRLVESTSLTSWNATSLVHRQQVESLQAELEHERSLRMLDQKRYDQNIQRMQKKLDLAVSEAKDLNELLQEERETSEQTKSALQKARNQAMQELRESKINLLHQEEYEAEEDPTALSLWQQKCQQLQEQLNEKESLYQDLRQEMEKLQQETLSKLEEYRNLKVSPPTPSPTLIEEAKPALLQELHKTRTELAHVQRQLRQLQRRYDNLQQDYNQCIRDKEKALLNATRWERLELDMKVLGEQHDQARALLHSWQDFGRTILASDTVADSNSSNIKHENGGIGKQVVMPADGSPPEALAVIQRWRDLQRRAHDYETRYHQATQQVSQLQSSLQETQEELRTCQASKREWQRERQSNERTDVSLRRKIDHLQAEIEIGKREADGLRELVKTFDGMPLGNSKLDATQLSLSVDLSKCREELQLAQEERERLLKDFELAQSQAIQVQEELDGVKEKYYKLLQALNDAKAKASLAEQRAIDAERLAGKGSFDPQETRVLHYRETPLTEALREEVKVLKRQLEKQAGKTHAADPEKLNQRLKENFKEQIGLFREGVYLMTGFKIDMLPGGSEHPTFRVRSVYQEREEDHLMLKWPKTDGQVSSLDILNTDFAKVLATTPAYDYMSKFHSLPAFLASTQLSLFERQTVMM